MAATNNWSAWWRRFLTGGDDARSSALNVLRECYIREKQNATRYIDYAKSMQYPQFREALRRMAAEEETHAETLAAKITKLGGRLPDVGRILIDKEPNSWHYLRSALEEEQRAADDMRDDLPMIAAEFPDIAELLKRIERDGKRHRAQLRDMLARSDPQSLGPP